MRSDVLDRAHTLSRMLEDEYGAMETRQLPNVDGQPKPPTLISVLRRALSTRLGCRLHDNQKHMWELLDDDRLGSISDDTAEQIINGI